jgi:VCBS repeat-containing protein
MKVFTLSTLALAAFLTACGGGGGGSAGNTIAVIGGTSAGSTSEGSTNYVVGTLTITDPDAGQAVFKAPASLAGTYGTFTFNSSTGAWTYLVDNTKAVTQALTSGQAVYDVLTVTSSDGTATLEIKITVTGNSSGGAGGGIALVSSVPAPVYPATDQFAADKVAVFNRLNDDRSLCGFGKVSQNALLDKAAQAHADYIALNKLSPTHYEVQGQPNFTGVDPGARVVAAGYSYASGDEILSQQVWGSFFAGTNISISELSATNNLRTLQSSVYHLAGAVGSKTEFGIGVSKFAQNANGTAYTKTLNIDFGVPTGSASLGQQIPTDSLSTFPCDGVVGVNPTFGAESPDPFPNVNRDFNPYGQPIYLMSSFGTALVLSSGSVALRGGAGVPVTVLTKDNDPQKRLTTNQVFVVPTQRLADNSTYDVVLIGTNTGMVSAGNPTGYFSRTFSFTTGTFTSE